MLMRLAFSAASAAMVAGLLLAVPGLSTVRHRITSISIAYLGVAIGLEIASCVSFAIVFRAFFDRVPAQLARRVAWVEMGSGALLPGGGVTSYALGGVLLSRAGMDTRSIVTRSGGVFWLTTAVNAMAVLVGSLLLLLGVGDGPRDFLRAGLPLLIAAVLTFLIAVLPVLVRRHPALQSRAWIAAIADGVSDATRAAKHPSWRLTAALGYLGLDIAVLACVLRGLGYNVNAGVLIIGYLLGYVATMIPIPAGIGVLESGIAGALVLYGTPAATTGAAVLIYHAIAFWIPSIGGCGASAALLLQQRNRNDRPRHPDQSGRLRRALHKVDHAATNLVARHYGLELIDPDQDDPAGNSRTAVPGRRLTVDQSRSAARPFACS
jgi:uncharacterized membrane protein YbhN (UPF0104 family)